MSAEAGRVGLGLSSSAVGVDEGGGVAEDERLIVAVEERARFAGDILATFASCLSERVSNSVSAGSARAREAEVDVGERGQSR